MIRNLLICTTSGLVLFTKDFPDATPQPRLLGSLLTTILEFSVLTAGMPLSYIEMENLSVTMAGNESTKLLCALLHDKEDGPQFSRIIAAEILSTFQEEYAGDLGAGGLNLKDFHGFHYRLGDVLKRSIQPVINKLGLVRGVLKVVLVTENSQTYQTSEVDQLGMLANLQALVALGTDIMRVYQDTVECLSFEGGPPNGGSVGSNNVGSGGSNLSNDGTRILVKRVDRSMLVVLTSQSIAPSKYRGHIDEAVTTLLKLSELGAALGTRWGSVLK
ncbi:unnamed protein product [Chrysoparadoxa australica]